MDLLKKLRRILSGQKNENSEPTDKKTERSIPSSILEIENELRKKEKDAQSIIDNSVNEMYDKLLPIIEKLDTDINALDKKDVSIIRDDPRLKHITETGRKDFLHQARELKEKLMRKKSGEEAIIHINAEIKKFVKYSRGSYIKTTQLIGEEAKRVIDDINEIIKVEESLIEESLKNLRSRDEVKVVLKSIENFKEEENKINDFREKIREAQKAIDSQKDRISKIDSEIDHIKLGQEFKEVVKASEELKAKEEEQGKKEEELKGLIDSKLLEKNLYNELDKVKIKTMEEYLKSPVERFLGDKDLLILLILEDTRRRIQNGEITFKNSDKIMKKLVIEKAEISRLQDSLIRLREDISSLRKKVSMLDSVLGRLRSERSELLDKVSEREVVLNTLVKKLAGLEAELNQRREKIRLEFMRI